MNVKFQKQPCYCLDMAVREVRNTELTQEIRLPEGLPDIGQILCAWGQILLRGKEWDQESVRISGGLMVWVLYAPEDGSQEQCLEGWIPFQTSWNLPENCPEGTLRVQPLLRSLDARSVSARKLLVRAGTSILGEAMVPREPEIWLPEEENGPELLKTRYPVCLIREAGEKTFLLDEELILPETAPALEAVVCCRVEPKVTERRVVGNTLAFRGNARIRLIYRGTDGHLHSWNFFQPFSQLAQLEGEYSGDAQAELTLCPTSMEPEQEEGRLRFKAGMAGQYLILDKQMVSICEDAYCPGRTVELERQPLELPAVLDQRRELLLAEPCLRGEVQELVDGIFLPDQPRVRRNQENVEILVPGVFQALYYSPEGTLQAGTVRWEASCQIPADREVRILAAAVPGEEPRFHTGTGQMTAQWEQPLELTAVTRTQLPMVTSVKLGEKTPPDPARPSLVLRRAGNQRLWDIAKSYGTTTAAIRRANGLSEEPAPDQMLLVPVP